MKAAVITRHAISNYGSFLQTLAMQVVVESLGHQCEIIDYIRDDETYFRFEISQLQNKPEWNHNPLKRALYLGLREPESILAGRKFRAAQKRYLNLTKRYSSGRQLRADKPAADVYITGSDQVWGPVIDGTYDDSYFLSFTGDGDKRIAYAASIGRAGIPEQESELFRRRLPEYRHITVREDNAVEILHGLGLDARQVLDPTLLLDARAWEQYAKPVCKEKYLLVYQIHNDTRLGIYAQKAAREMNLKLLRISPMLHQVTRPGKLIWLPGIGEFLSYIKQAECLITDSFHGTAFAINFNTPFVAVMPNNDTKSRNMSVLRLTGLSHRVLQNEDDIDLPNQPMDFTRANAVLAGKRNESIGILKKMIES